MIDETSQEYIDGFTDGLHDGRNHLLPAELHRSETYEAGYNDGYMEGTGL